MPTSVNLVVKFVIIKIKNIMQGYKMYCKLNRGYIFAEFVDMKRNGKISKNIKNIFNRYYTKRLRRRIKRFND